jgi:hypothetical protein
MFRRDELEFRRGDLQNAAHERFHFMPTDQVDGSKGLVFELGGLDLASHTQKNVRFRRVAPACAVETRLQPQRFQDDRAGQNRCWGLVLDCRLELTRSPEHSNLKPG